MEKIKISNEELEKVSGGYPNITNDEELLKATELYDRKVREYRIAVSNYEKGIDANRNHELYISLRNEIHDIMTKINMYKNR